MHVVVFGLTISSSWGNGHATIWRGLCRGLAARHHHVTFFEHDVPYYAAHRDLYDPAGCTLQLYNSWHDVLPSARAALRDADVAMVTSYCPDGRNASREVLASTARIRTFYDLDTPITLEALQNGEQLAYIGPRKLADFDLVLSYTGGAALDALRDQLDARRVVPLFGSVDPDVHHPAPKRDAYLADLSYLGTYAPDR